MSDVHMCGIIANTNMKQLDYIFRQLFKNCKYSIENMSELYIENTEFDIFIQDDSAKIKGYVKGNYDYLFNGLHEGGLDKARRLLEEISATLERNNLKYSFEFFEEDSQGIEKEKQYLIKHPEF